MTNIWADSFSAIREPFFEEKKEKEEKGEKKHKEGSKEENAEEGKSSKKRWWDDDGDGVGYEEGEVGGKFSKKKVKKEETELDEAQVANRNPDEYERKQKGINNPNTGINSKAFLDFYAKNAPQPKKKPVQKEERELRSKNSKGDKLDVRKGIKNKIEVNPKITEALVYGGEPKKEPEDKRMVVTNVDKKGNTKAWQNYKSGNKSYKAAPHVKEEIQEWIYELVDEGYDIDQFTIDELIEIYEGDTFGMPAKGDAERQKVDPMSAAKAKAAKAKVSKERADYQVAQQAQRMKVSTTESILNYVETRNKLFEGVFDPKKSKLKPAAERTKNTMTDAQRKASKKEDERIANIHSKGETVLAGLRPQGKKGKVQTTPTPKSKAPEANRTVKGKEDKLGSAADKVLKALRK